ncbi:MAG: SGNH/GDSL hydrolase family protein, partial [Planctomycetia bacterium]|nr:SGNH/GDSL hydrolase family protein [Planctomycetia bacterium]
GNHSYFGRLVENPDDELPDVDGICLRAVLPNLTVKNLAVSGTTSLEHVEILRDRLDPREQDTFGLVVMTTGGNDLIHNYGRTPPREGAMYGATLEQARPWIEAFEKRLHEMIDLIEQRFPGGCLIFLADIYDPSDGVGDAASAGLPEWKDCLAIHGAYNDVIRRVAEARPSVRLVPMHEVFLGHGIHCAQPWREHYRREDAHYWYATNLEDPNDRGYDAIRRVFLIEMAKAAPMLGSAGRAPAGTLPSPRQRDRLTP